MGALIERLNQRWAALSQREKAQVMILVGLLLIGLAYYIWHASQQYRITQKANYQKSSQELNWMHNKAHLFQQQAVAIDDTSNPNSLYSGVTSSLRQFDLRYKRIKPDAKTNSLSLDFDNAPFDVFWQWLVNLQGKEGVYIKSINVSKQETSGLADIRVVVGK